MLVELRLVEQRYQAVLEAFNDGATVTDAARRHGVARQTVHGWLRRYAAAWLEGLADRTSRTSRPAACPHQMSAVVEARIVELHRAHPGWVLARTPGRGVNTCDAAVDDLTVRCRD